MCVRVRCYCITVLGGISLSLNLVWTSTSCCDVSMVGFGWVLRWNAAGFLSLSLSGECSGLQRMFDGFTGEEIWSGGVGEGEEEGGGVVLRRGYTKGVMDAFERKSFWLSKFASNGNVNKKFRGNRSIPSSSEKLWEIKIEFFWKSFLPFKNANNSVEEFCGSDRWNSRGLVLRGFVNWERCDDW